MRILHLIATMDPAAGGPIESVRMLMRFHELGYDGEAVTMDDPAAPFLIGLPFRVSALGPQTTVYGFNRKLVPWLRQNRDRFDGFVINGLWQYNGLAALRAIAGRKPYVVFTHGMLDPYFRYRFPLKHLKKWLYWIAAEYWVLRRAHRVLFTCQAEKVLAEKSFWLRRWKPQVVPYGATGPEGDRNEMLKSFQEIFPLVRGNRYLLFLGRIDRKKGCDLLIDAFVRSSARDPDLHLVMAGPDPNQWRKKLEAVATEAGCANRIHWTGMLQGNAKWGAFLGCEAFILPSHQENFGIAVAEALSCGKPVLLADKVNIAPEIEQDGAGYMEQDTASGTDALLRRWSETSPERRQAMSAQASTTFRARYDMRENAKAIVRLFQDATVDREASFTAQVVETR